MPTPAPLFIILIQVKFGHLIACLELLAALETPLSARSVAFFFSETQNGFVAFGQRS
jgi:hypothetical protein